MLKFFTPFLLITMLLCLGACNDTPMVVFHSYDELTEYSFFGDDWVPEIVQNDITDIRETYAVENGHVFGRLDFVHRALYDSIFGQYGKANQDSVLMKIHSIKRPKYPDWFIPENELISGKYAIATHHGFYLWMAQAQNRIYFVK